MSEWQPIETAPKDGTVFQSWWSDGSWEPWTIIYNGYIQVWDQVGYEGEEDWVPMGNAEHCKWVATHWMPLPEPPQ